MKTTIGAGQQQSSVCVALSLAVEQHVSQQRHLSGGHEERAARRSRQRAQRRQRVAVGVGEAAGRRRRCVSDGVNQMLRAELRDVESCVTDR